MVRAVHLRVQPLRFLSALALLLTGVCASGQLLGDPVSPVAENGAATNGIPTAKAVYRLASVGDLRSSSIAQLLLHLGPAGTDPSHRRWTAMEGLKGNGDRFTVWVLSREFPCSDSTGTNADISRYILQEGGHSPTEFSHLLSGLPVLPTLGGWKFLWPRPAPGASGFAPEVDWLGHRYVLEKADRNATFPMPQAVRQLSLQPDVLVGVPSNRRTRDDRRRFDESDYETVRLSRADYEEMIGAGMNCFRVDAEQASWLLEKPVFVWGIGGSEVPFPECLYRSTYLGPTLFLDEPAVGTRDHDLRPRLAKDPAFRRQITPEIALDAFRRHYRQVVREGAPSAFLRGLRARPDVELGDLSFSQQNLYSWETMVECGAWELTAESSEGPRAIVFEPPGRVGSRRTLPEMNMVYGCQLSPDNVSHLTGILFGFLRGAARAAGKDWGVSIYGAVDRSDAPHLLTHAYDQGATHFFFWDNYQLACVPYGECLALSRHLQAHVAGHPDRDLPKLRRMARVAVLLPPGYGLGHTHMGRGNLWGLGELNLERTNRFGVPYRQVMSNFFVEIERCLRLGDAFDLLWDLEGLPLDGYQEIIRVREDGRVSVSENGKSTLRRRARLPERSLGKAPDLEVECASAAPKQPLLFTARAHVREGSAPVYYTTGANRQGVYPNTLVLWELFGPQPEDYRQVLGRVILQDASLNQTTVVETEFALPGPGQYRLRAATTDLAGRSTVVWKTLRATR